MALANFLNKHTVKAGSTAAKTHTRIGDINLNIPGGSYNIPVEREDEFYNLMYQDIIQGNRLEYLTEKQHETGAIYVDLDFHYKYEVTERQHTYDNIMDLISSYLENLKKLMNITAKPFKLFIMQKDSVNRVAAKNITKDGIHILIGINCPHKVQEKLREMVMADCAERLKDLPLINTMDQVFDSGLSKGSTNVQLFGCRKPAHDAYKLTHAFDIVIDERDSEFCMKDYATDVTKDTFLHMCVRNKHLHADFELTRLANSVLNPEVVEYDTDVNLTNCNTDIQKLLAVIGSTRCGPHTYNDWVAVAQVIKNETKDAGLADFVGWTMAYGTINKKNEAINKYQNQIKYTPKSNKNRLSIATLHWWAKNDNPAAYRMAFQTTITEDVVVEPDMVETYNIIDAAVKSRTEYATAVAFNKLYTGLQKCVDKQRKEYYCFDNETKLWNFDVGGTPIRNRLSTEFHDLFTKYKQIKEAETFEPNSPQDEANKKQIKTITEIARDLQNTTNKNNILTEISDICKDVNFPSTLNKSEYIIPTNDGKVLDMQTLVLTDRTIAHNFSYECNAKLIPYDKDDAKFILADKYFDDLFRGNMETKACVINILKSVFIGRPLRYIYFCIGEGSNGKSLLFKIINKIFGNFMDVISESVIIEQKGTKSALNTEIEKLDKCRLGYITELKESDKLNEKVIKQISGGDAINLRTLHTKDHTINPTCNLFVLTNEMPTFNGEAVSMLNRMITIPFKNKFVVKDEFEREMLAISDHIFSYIMHTGTICDKFALSAEMIEEKDKHARNNTETTLADYLKVRLVDCVNDNKANKLLLVNDIRVDFEHYCERSKLKNSISARKFPAKLRELGYTVKETNSKVKLYGKKFVDIVSDETDDIPNNAENEDITDNDSGEE
jgi:phage/plasmid-associated DNA primase